MLNPRDISKTGKIMATNMKNLITPSPTRLHCSESPGKNSKEKVHLCIYCLLKLKYNPPTWGLWIIFGHNNKISCSTCKFYMAVLQPGSVIAAWPWPQPVLRVEVWDDIYWLTVGAPNKYLPFALSNKVQSRMCWHCSQPSFNHPTFMYLALKKMPWQLLAIGNVEH